MTKEVTVLIDGSQLDTEEETVRTTASGVYRKLNGKHVIHYEESIDGGEGITKNTVSIASEHVEIVKKGVISTVMSFDLLEPSQTFYQTPYGRLLLQIQTTELLIEESQDEIKVRLRYLLSVNGEYLSDNQILIRVNARN